MRDVARLRRARGKGGNHRRIDDANIGGLQSGGNSRFLQLCEQPVVERFVGFGVALEDVVLHHALGHQIGFNLLLIESSVQKLLTLLRLVVITFEARDDGFRFSFETLIQFLELSLEPEDLGKVGTVLSEGIGVLGRQISALAKQVLDGQALADLRDGLGVAGLGEFEERLLLHAVALRIDQLAVDLSETLRGDVLFVVELPNLIFSLVVEASILGILHADAQLIELVGEPGSGRGGGVVAAAATLVDIILNVGVDGLRGHFGLGSLEGYVHQPAVGDALDA